MCGSRAGSVWSNGWRRCLNCLIFGYTSALTVATLRSADIGVNAGGKCGGGGSGGGGENSGCGKCRMGGVGSGGCGDPGSRRPGHIWPQRCGLRVQHSNAAVA